ncbi:hypothetical protein XELAEV_18029012mg [Xenopus laevis]|uniref:Uncharacterized protein n=1 Tax=Xenopus laevis TaxID=8355 RepID=A0A974HHA7_XENLA|nr:hypothetical protein XELAEV_18029012mg [Xenopus laevis]
MYPVEYSILPLFLDAPPPALSAQHRQNGRGFQHHSRGDSAGPANPTVSLTLSDAGVAAFSAAASSDRCD